MTEKDTANQSEFVSAEITGTDSFDISEHSAEVDRLLAEVHADRVRRENLVRPHISVLRAVLNVLLPLAACAGVFCALRFTLHKHRLGIPLGVSLGALGLYIVIRLRAILIWCIKVYQAAAPDEVRLRCVFTPSCSEYAILALEKYGVIRGVPKIIGRLKRCHLPNGGADELE